MDQVIQTGTGAAPSVGKRPLLVASGAHILHDGYTDLLYVLLSVWQAEFGLDFAQVGTMRALYAGTMAGFQVPVGMLAERFDPRMLLAVGTAIAAGSFILAGFSSGVWTLAGALMIGGLGASVQHPVASSLVARAYEGPRSRAALGTYNFAGDIGKMAFPAVAAALLLVMPWRGVVGILAVVGLVAALAMWLLLPHADFVRDAGTHPTSSANGVAAGGVMNKGFSLLLSIGVIDTATRMGFLTFLPFLLKAKGASVQTVGLALTLIFVGGAGGKLFCAWLGQRYGVLRTVYLTEGLTALGILAMLPMSLPAAMAVLPLIGVALNGTSSVLYGTVPDLIPVSRRERAFSIFYTGTIGAGALSPVLYGLVSDQIGIPSMMLLVAGVALLTLPLAWLLGPALKLAKV
jgi:MFS transporter, FSR family, fosmidomycin resistance protein